MAQLGFAVAGAVVGSTLFPAVAGAAGWGFLAGSLIGSMFTSNRIEGPRLEDLRVTVSTYGLPKPIGYGHPRMSGNVIWSTGLQENEREIDAKGGFGPSQVVYEYSCSFAVAFTHRPSCSVVRIWMDGKLQYDARPPEEGEESEAASRNITFRFYDGRQTAPDPLIEAAVGVGRCPAFKDMTYIVFEDLPLADFGNRAHPNVEAEIAFLCEESSSSELYMEGIYAWPNQNCMVKDPNRPYLYVYGGASNSPLRKTDMRTKEILAETVVPGSQSSTTMAVDQDGYLWLQQGTNNASTVWKYEPNGLTTVGRCGVPGISYVNQWQRIPRYAYILPCIIQEKKVVVTASNGMLSVFSQNDIDTVDSRYLQFYGQLYITEIAHTNQPPIVQDSAGTFWMMGAGAELVEINITLTPNGDPVSYPGTETVATIIANEHSLQDWIYPSSSEGTNGIVYNPDDHSLLIFSSEASLDADNTLVAKFDIDTETIVDEFQNASNMAPHYRGALQIGVQNGLITAGNRNSMYVLNASDLTIHAGPYNFDDWIVADERGYFWDESTRCFYWSHNRTGGDPNRIWRYCLEMITPLCEDLADVVEDLCLRTNRLVEADLDVESLRGHEVCAYGLGRQMKIADAIKPLALGYLFDGFESDWMLKFRMRDDENGETFAIAEEHLGESGDAGKLIETYHQEAEAPELVNVLYLDLEKDQQQGAQLDRRAADAVTTRQRETLQIPLGFTATEAKQIAQRWLYTLWTERVGHEAILPPRYLRLDPADRGTIELDDNLFSVRLFSVHTGANLAQSIQAVETDRETYDSTVTGYGGDGVPEQTIVLPDPTNLIALDVPYLRDEDHSNGASVPLYFALGPYGDNWAGAIVYKSEDRSAWTPLFAETTPAVWGYATTALPDATRADGSEFWASWDRLRTVTVRLIVGTLESHTALEVLNGANAFALQSGDGWEIGQFVTATDNGDGTYTLSTLLRGRRGTNLFTVGHAVGDAFVMLGTDSVRRYNAPNSDISLLRYYRALTLGSVMTAAPDSIELTLAANAYKPYSPVSVSGTRDGSNNLTITWIRRTRVGGAWLNGSGTVPLGEETEAYEVDILNGSGAVVRTIEVTSPTATYTAAEQTTDFGSTQSAVTVRVYQLNAQIDRGFYNEETL